MYICFIMLFEGEKYTCSIYLIKYTAQSQIYIYSLSQIPAWDNDLNYFCFQLLWGSSL